MFAETCRRNLLAIAAAYAAAEDIPLSTVSKRAYGHVRFFDNLAGGSCPTIGTVSDVLDYFRDNWPEGARWPDLLPDPWMGREHSRAKRRINK